MIRRTFLASLAALPFANMAFAQAKPLSLRELSAYLNSLKDAQGAFTQINADGSKSKGKFYLKRPGRMRFEYEPPNAAMVVAGQGTLAIFDQKSNTGPQQYPLIKTPLHIILKRKVNLAASGMVVAHQFDGTNTSITAQDPENPNYGNVKLVFSAKPATLRQWIVTDESGQRTTVKLGQLQTDKRLKGGLFDIKKLIRTGTANR